MSAKPGFEVAAVLASHGDRAGSDRNSSLLAHAQAVRALTGLATVTAGVLKGEPAIEAALRAAQAAGAGVIVVYPLFMAEGYFARTVLAERIRAAGLEAASRVLAPLGLDPGLPLLMLDDALDTARAGGIDPAGARLLVVGHGSKFGPASAEATVRAGEALRAAGRFGTVATAFLEEAPFLADALTGGQGPTVVSGFFYGDGMHAGEDVPGAIREARSDAVYAGSVGGSKRIASLIAAAIRAEVGGQG